jgi:hypothetical protein
MRNRTRSTATVFILLLSSALIVLPGGSQPPSPAGKKAQTQAKDVVYVCACLKTKSCSCMTEAKTEGPCACGTSGGPPLKEVPRDSDWAKENRDALAR